MLEASCRVVLENVGDITLEEALFVPSGGYRSILGILKHIAGWSHVYHAGELNQVLSICRGEAWEKGEEVEENHISTVGHRVRPPWLANDDHSRKGRFPTAL